MKQQRSLFRVFTVRLSILKLLMPLVSGILVMVAANSVSAQSDAGPIRSSPAYAEVLLRKTEITADIEALSEDYTEANPKMIDLRAELASLDRSLEKIFGVKPSETGKLTLALGKLLVRRAALEADLGRLSRSYNKDHPEVKRATRKLEIYDSAVKEVLK